MFDKNVNAPPCFEHRNYHFYQIYLLDKSDRENELD